MSYIEHLNIEALQKVQKKYPFINKPQEEKSYAYPENESEQNRLDLSNAIDHVN